MAHVLIVTHGMLAEALLASAKMIIGEEKTRGVDCLDMTEEKSMDQFCQEARTILEANPDDNYLIMADVFGASPCNSCLSVFRNANYRIITGVNLPMILELLMENDNIVLPKLWEGLIESGKKSIMGVYLPA